jgi:hypothetical protein
MTAGVPAGVPVLSASPNPTRGDLLLTLNGVVEQASAGVESSRVEIWDTAGRLVQVLELVSGGDRVATARWNGRTVRGAPVPAGIYFVRASGLLGATRPSTRIVILR